MPEGVEDPHHGLLPPAGRDGGDAEVGDDDHRGSYGASPGDGSSAEPYLYVAPWSGVPDEGDRYWNAVGFGGALLSYERLLEAEDQRRAALDFFRAGWSRLTA